MTNIGQPSLFKIDFKPPMMKRSFYVTGSMLAVSLLIVSYSKDKNSGNNDNPGGGSGSTSGTLFTAVRSVMQTNCAVSECHTGSSPAGGLSLSADNPIVAQKARIKVRAVDQAGTPSQMPVPPNAALSAADQKKITDWITAGGTLTN